MIRIELPWPHRDLQPNEKAHWGAKSRATKQARALAGWTTHAFGIRRGDMDIPGALKVTVSFCPPDRRRRDIDNLIAACKPYFDGIVDVIGVDDSKWEWNAPRREEPRKGGAVFIELEAA
jgi:crossover junction endodeoxyribonuclease RusA